MQASFELHVVQCRTSATQLVLGRQQLKSTLPSLVVGGGRISDNEGTTSFLRETALPREARKFEGAQEFLTREGIRISAKRGEFFK